MMKILKKWGETQERILIILVVDEVRFENSISRRRLEYTGENKNRIS